jgi:hypothetical protein
MPIRRFLRDEQFDPAVVSAIESAFRDICKGLEEQCPLDVSHDIVATKIIHGIVATEIIEVAKSGETDPVVLREMVLDELGLC